MIVKELRAEPYDAVLLFKLQHSTSADFAAVPSNVFILGIQTQWKKEVFVRYANTIFCIDSTHGTNAYLMSLAKVRNDQYKFAHHSSIHNSTRTELAMYM